MYDPKTGQFLSRDPMDTGDPNRYRYVGNNPINLVDPTGYARVSKGGYGPLGKAYRNPTHRTGNALLAKFDFTWEQGDEVFMVQNVQLRGHLNVVTDCGTMRVTWNAEYMEAWLRENSVVNSSFTDTHLARPRLSAGYLQKLLGRTFDYRGTKDQLFLIRARLPCCEVTSWEFHMEATFTMRDALIEWGERMPRGTARSRRN